MDEHLIADSDEARRTVAEPVGAGGGSAKRFSRLFDSNIAGMIICDVHGDVTEANDAFLDMLGYRRGDLPLRWDRMTPPEYRGLDESKVAEVMSTGAGVAWEKEYLARDGRRVPILVAVVLLDASRGECLAIVNDLSQRKQMEGALRKSEETYRTLYENIPLMYLTLATDGTIRSVNTHGAAELGYQPEELVGQPVLMLVHREDHAAVGEELATGATDPEAIDYWEARLVRKSGSIMWTRAARRVIQGADGEDVLLVACTDVTLRRQAEQEIIDQKKGLRALTAELGLAEERERRRISTGLHDDIGHTLALAELRLGQLLRTEPSSEEARTIRDVRGLLARAIESTRSLTFDLSSSVLYELGFEAALESVGEEMARRHCIRFGFRAEQRLPPMADDLTVVLYRIVRELLSNVMKHARAQSVRLCVRASAREVEITLEDDGVGFDVTGAGDGFGPDGGFGLFSSRAQLRHVGGRLEIESAPGRGTRAVVIAPLATIEDETT